MGRKFIDASLDYSDPAKSGKKHMRADGQWIKPDAQHKFADALAEWTVPELAPPIPGSESEFQAMSWEQLAQMSAACASAGATDYQKLLGYTKPVTVTGVGTVTTRLIGLCHDTYVGGGTAGFTFQLQDGLSMSKPVNMQMNASNIVTGGWRDSVMRKTNIPALLAALPSDLRSVIKKVNKKTSTANSGTAVSTTSDDLFLLSLVESIGTNKTAYTDNPIASSNYLYNEGTQYEYYKQFDGNKTNAFNAHIIKNASGSADYWWLRSIRLSYASGFYYMNTSGDWGSGGASSSYLPPAGFCL